MALSLTDIRSRCGGLCDSTEPCSMRGNVEPCTCGVSPVHSVRQHAFATAQRSNAATFFEQVSHT